jgi:hypothetical protein
MTTAAGCSAKKLQFTPGPDGKPTGAPVVFDRIKYGEGRRAVIGERCPDCGVKQGRHHHPGCDWEECPRCHGQSLGCSCNDEGTFADIVEVR